MVFVVGVKDDLVVVGKELGHGGPPGFEAVDIGNDFIVVPTEVVGVNDSVATLASDILDNLTTKISHAPAPTVPDAYVLQGL